MELVGEQRVRGRRGDRAVYVFETPAVVQAAKTSDRERFYRFVGRMLEGECAELRRRPAKGKPVSLQVFESDTDANRVRTQPALSQTGALAAQSRATGAGQVVAVLDGGFDLSHTFLAGRLAGAGYDAVDDDMVATDLGNRVNEDAAYELNGDLVMDRIIGHGTFVSSLVLAVAPDAKILPVRVLDDEGWGTTLSVASGITYAVENGATVINMSLVVPDASQLEKDAIRAAVDAGVVIVSAAGTVDDGWQNDVFLASRALIVGATDADDVVTDFSLAGLTVRVFAPGTELRGALWNDGYGRWSGVSFAVPFLAGGAAMIRELHPRDWSPGQVRDRLASYVDLAFGAADDPLRWRGRVDLSQAVPSR
jgi:hypothetical protein